VPGTPRRQDQQQLPPATQPDQQQPPGQQRHEQHEHLPGPSAPQVAFCHAFDFSKSPISALKFARGSADCLAWGDIKGVVYVATAEQPPRLLQVRVPVAAAGGGLLSRGEASS